MKKKSEQRSVKREQCLVPVDGKKGSFYEGIRSVDIGRGGIGLISAKSIPIDEKIVVQLELSPEDDPILVLGQVKWVSKVRNAEYFRVGMSFCEDVCSGSRSRLKKFLS